MTLRTLCLVALLTTAAVAPLASQHRRVHPVPVLTPPPGFAPAWAAPELRTEHAAPAPRAVTSRMVLGLDQEHDGSPPSLVWPAALSAALPGAGQLTLGRSRGWAHLGVEALGWLLWSDRRGAGADARAAYRDFAWDVGRLQFAARVDGDFDYYETLSQWDRSGLFDTDSRTSGIQPEMDPTTYNGSIWSLATRLFPQPANDPDPAPRAEALEYYMERAYGDELSWDWTLAQQGARNRFGELIEESDAKYRQATNVMGVILANHVVAAVDAFLAARSDRERVRLDVASMPDPGTWGLLVRVPIR